jgi:hypothetical protein
VNLQPIYPAKPVFYAHCFQCGKSTRSNELLADLDGPAFRAYYCAECAKGVQQ